MNNKPKVDPILILGIIIFFIAGCVYAYSIYGKKSIDSNVAVTTPGSTLNPVSSGTSSTSTIVAVVQGTTSVKTAPVKTISTTTTNTQSSPASTTPAPISSDVALCNAASLDGSASLQKQSNESVYGIIKVNNRGTASCGLSPYALISILSNNTTLSISESIAPSKGLVEIAPKQSTNVNFIWSNYCSAATLSPLQIKYVLPENQGYLQLPAISSAGAAENTSPSCISSGSGSMLFVQ